jgi:hypothetical protein
VVLAVQLAADAATQETSHAPGRKQDAEVSAKTTTAIAKTMEVLRALPSELSFQRSNKSVFDSLCVLA